ncbi:hypothetical protein CMUS01_15058 [Colletotrichum musicola]|uniref:Uncharacterized protein n=1 Tax=Colletotrichum musicola TaxID=2175873 RepID=A0A8H6MNQ5_9PEZI|nr:hypothetical protein CMUS01_15058 [Colletotrichum musicola]
MTEGPVILRCTLVPRVLGRTFDEAVDYERKKILSRDDVRKREACDVGAPTCGRDDASFPRRFGADCEIMLHAPTHSLLPLSRNYRPLLSVPNRPRAATGVRPGSRGIATVEGPATTRYRNISKGLIGRYRPARSRTPRCTERSASAR